MPNDDDCVFYMASCGKAMAEFDMAQGNGKYHRDASNHPAYRDAYDSAMRAGSVNLEGLS
jgi:hypothetical protein